MKTIQSPSISSPSFKQQIGRTKRKSISASGGTAYEPSISVESSCGDSREHGTESADFISTACAWVVFHAVAVYTAASRWLRFKRVCAWHKPQPIWMGGNPLARRVTHGICRDCAAKWEKEVFTHYPKQ